MEPHYKVLLTLELTPETNARLDAWVRETGASSKVELFRKMIALYEVALEAKRSGRRFGVAAPGQALAIEVTGI